MSSTQKRRAKPKPARKPKTRAPKKRVVQERKAAEKPVSAPVAREEHIQEKTFLFAVRLKGEFGTPAETQRILSSLRLNKKFNAVLLENASGVISALRVAKDYLTWGDVGPNDVATLLRHRGELEGGIPISDKNVQERLGHASVDELAKALVQGQLTLKTLREKGLKPVFRLHAPTGGFESSTKRAFGSRGELGPRGPAISHLMSRMI